MEEDLLVARRNIEAHRSLGSDPGADLVVWGEGALDPAALEDPATVAATQAAIAAVGVPTTIGAVVNDPDGSQHTSVLAFDGHGDLVDRYDKVHLVPFGEYVPFRRRLTWIDAIGQIPVDRVPGESLHTIAQPGIPPYGTPICFENAFPSIPRTFVRDGAAFLVVPVNNASYLFTAAAAQHLQMSQMRAVETGRWVVDAGVSGISAFIDPAGVVQSRTGLFQPAILRGQVQASTAQTVYVRFGDWVPILSMVMLAMSVLTPRRRTLARPLPGPLPAPLRALAILPTYNERDTIAAAIIGRARDARGRRARRRRFLARRHRGHRPGDRRGRAAGPPARRDRRNRGSPAPTSKGSRSRSPRATTWRSRWTPTFPTTPPSSRASCRPPRGFDLVVGSRYVPGGSVTDWSRRRVALSRAGNLYARLMLGLPIHDATSGYRVYRAPLLEELLRRPFAADGYGFQVELVLRSHRLGYAVGEAPITFRDRAFGESKISNAIVLEALWMVTRWGFDLRFRSALASERMQSSIPGQRP